MEQYAVLDFLTRNDLEYLKTKISAEELAKIDKFKQDIVRNMRLRDDESVLLAERMFELGYLASFITLEKSKMSHYDT